MRPEAFGSSVVVQQDVTEKVGGAITNSELGGAEPVPGSASDAATQTNQPFPAAADRNLTICRGLAFKNVLLSSAAPIKIVLCA